MTQDKIIQKAFDSIDFTKFKECNNKIPHSSDCADCCSKEYFVRKKINYDTCTNKRKLYVVRYLPVHQYEIYSILNQIPPIATNLLLKKHIINVLSIGGGPGTDIAAFNKWIGDQHLFDEPEIQKIHYMRLDIEEKWNEFSPKVTRIDQYKKIECDYMKTIFDICEKLEEKLIVEDQEKVYDLILMSYIISELTNKCIKILAENIQKLANSNFILIINDRNENTVNEKIALLLKNIQYDEIKFHSTKGHCGFTFPDAVMNIAKPKIFTSSIRYCIVKNR